MHPAIQELRVADVLAERRRRAWQLVRRCGQERAPAVARRLALAPDLHEDLVQELLVRAFDLRRPALRRARRGTPLSAWVWGTLLRIGREWKRAEPTVDIAEPAVQARIWSGTAGPAPRTPTLRTLTARQRRAVSIFLRRGCVADVGRDLDIAWTTARELLDRAIARLAKRRPLDPRHQKRRGNVAPDTRKDP